MAASAFLEEALTIDVDESAVNAIVGSLETTSANTPVTLGASLQQTSSDQKQQQQHPNNNKSNNNNNSPNANCSITTVTTITTITNVTTTSSTQMVNSMTVKASPTPTNSLGSQVPLSSVNVVVAGNPSPQSQQQQQQQSQSFINQVANNQVTSNQTNQQISALAIATAAGGANKLTFPTQSNVAQLANGTLGVVTTTTQALLQSTTNAITNVTGGAQTNIKGAPGGMVSVPMSSVPVTVAAANLTAQTQQQQQQGPTQAGVASPAIVPTNVQILNAMRPGTPVAGQQQAKQATRVVTINQTMAGGRAGAPGVCPITLQTLQGLQGTQGGQLLVKTENGQFHLIRVQPGTGVGAGAVTANSLAGNVIATQGGTIRLLPGVSRLNAQFTGPPLATIRKPVQTVAPTVTTTTVTPATSTIVATTTTTPAPTPAVVQTTPAAAQVKRAPSTDNTKEKCRKFLANLLELSSREPKHVEKNVRTLIQELINVEVEPEVFCVRLEKLLNASPQPCLIGFLKKSLPLLRQSLVKNEMVIEGIRPPPAEKVFTIETSVTNQNQSRTSAAVASASSVGGVPTQVVASPGSIAAPQATQLRVMTPMAGVTNVPRPPQPVVQQRPMRPVTVARPPAKTYSIKTATGQTQIQSIGQPLLQPPTPQQLQMQHQQQTMIVTTATGQQIRNAAGQVIVQQKSLPSTTTAKTHLQNKMVTTASLQNKSAVPSILNKSTSKEKEKKAFSSGGFAGDIMNDDINDVAAMGGVNLAEESQRILGSTKFVGTQIRSCKDEAFVHMSALQQKINNIASINGLEEPSQEVLLLISHAVQERLKNFVEKLSVIAEHRIDFAKNDPRYEVTQDVRAQLKFLEELDKVERKRHEEQERETLMKVAKSRAKTEDPEQAKLKAKAKEMQRAEMEEARQREANQTALQAIGPRKKPKLDFGDSGSNPSGSGSSLTSAGGLMNRPMPLRPRIKRVTLRDLQFVLEQEKDTCRGIRLYKSYL